RPADGVRQPEQNGADAEARDTLDRLPRVCAAAGKERARPAECAAAREIDTVVERVRHARGRVDPVDAETAEDRRRARERVDRRADVMPEAGKRQLLGAETAAAPLCSLVDDNVEAGTRELDRRREAVRPRADDYCASQLSRGSGSGVSTGSICARRCSNAGGRINASPRCAGSSSAEKPGPSVAISK